jgi:hypothetical protein
MDEASLRMLARETGAPEWVCRLALGDLAPVEPTDGDERGFAPLESGLGGRDTPESAPE